MLARTGSSSKMSLMDKWRIGTAKQRFSEVVRLSGAEPQKIYNRGRLVAAVVSPADLDAIERLRNRPPVHTLAESLSEIRQICAEEEYDLEIPRRSDRPGWRPVDGS